MTTNQFKTTIPKGYRRIRLGEIINGLYSFCFRHDSKFIEGYLFNARQSSGDMNVLRIVHK